MYGEILDTPLPEDLAEGLQRIEVWNSGLQSVVYDFIEEIRSCGKYQDWK